MPRIVEVYEHLGSYHQRTLFEVHPELTFFQINEDQPLRYSKHTSEGRKERETLLRKKMPGIERVLAFEEPRVRFSHLLDAAASLWTARRILSKGITRLPEDPEWDAKGFRMELLR
jgi:predicted RNase H-like nuclease